MRFPTRVGMVRSTGQPHRRCSGFPHRRGDGPMEVAGQLAAPKSSPQAWGWSVVGLPLSLRERVFPTRVGMVRWLNSVTKRASRFPHTRGDGPTTGEGKNEVVTNRDHLSIHRIGLLTGDFGAETPGPRERTITFS